MILDYAFSEKFSLKNLKDHGITGPFLGIDWGKKRVGIALSDPTHRFALPLYIVKAGGVLRHTLVDLWEKHHIGALIIGWPCHEDGTPGPLCPLIQRLILRLNNDHGWPCALWDETLSSHHVYATLHDISREARTTRGLLRTLKHVDDHAAASILQGALSQWHCLTPTSQN